MDLEASHVAYSDESNYNSGPFRGVAMLSIPDKDRAQVEQTIKEIVHASNVKELKWKGLRSARDRHAALRVARFVLALARDGVLRVDAMSWAGAVPSDLKTQRPAVESLEVMYYHLFRTVMGRRWSPDARWSVIADEHTGINWRQLRELTNLNGWGPVLSEDDDGITITTQVKWQIASLHTGRSDREPLIQVADLFAGLSCFSRENSRRYWRWEKSLGQASLSGESGISNSDRERFTFMAELNEMLKGMGLDVALGYQGFITLNPSVPINFWHWRPKAAIEAKQARLQV